MSYSLTKLMVCGTPGFFRICSHARLISHRRIFPTSLRPPRSPTFFARTISLTLAAANIISCRVLYNHNVKFFINIPTGCTVAINLKTIQSARVFKRRPLYYLLCQMAYGKAARLDTYFFTQHHMWVSINASGRGGGQST